MGKMAIRDVAQHIWVDQLEGSQFVESQDSPSSLLLADGRMVKRVRIYGICVGESQLVIDDGSGSLLIRTFSDAPIVSIGEPIMVIGRPRMFENQVYVLGEIVKSIDSKWLKVIAKQYPKSAAPSDPISVVRELDSGEGADYELVVSRLGNGGEDMVVHLLAVGELFETRPGKLKVLE